MDQMRLVIKRKGVEYVLKTCPACSDEWYAKRKQNRCTLCGSGLVMRTKENIDRNWDELKPDISNAALATFLKEAGLR